MKGKIGACIAVTALLATGAICFAACGDGHTHEYNVRNQDEISHWYECECGEKDESTVTAHNGGTATCEAKAVCSECNTAYGALDPTNHTSTEFDYISNGDNTHTKTHECCGAVAGEPEACTGGTATCEAKAECEVCNTVYGALDPTNHTSTEFDYTSNGDNTHTKKHECCGAVADAAEGCSGGTATCLVKAECEHCGAEHGNLAAHTYTAWDTSDEVYDKKKCSVAGCGHVSENEADWFKKTVTAANQDLLMTATSFSLSLAGAGPYDSVVSIKLGDTDLGTNLSALNISDELKADTQNHGVKTVTVTVLDSDGAQQHVINVPVTLVTYAIASTDDFKNNMLVNKDKTVIYGYYTLTTNVTCQIDYDASKFSGFDYWGENTGFQGTLDGRNYTLTSKGVDQTGLMGIVKNAVIKDITIVDGYRKAYANGFLLARGVFNSVFENVTFRCAAGSAFTDVGTTSGGSCCGWICGVEFSGNTLKNVTVIEDANNFGSIFGCKFMNNTIENLVVTENKGNYTEIGHIGSSATVPGTSIGYGDTEGRNVWVGLETSAD